MPDCLVKRLGPLSLQCHGKNVRSMIISEEACSAERTHASARQILCCGYREFSRALTNARSIEHTSELKRLKINSTILYQDKYLEFFKL